MLGLQYFSFNDLWNPLFLAGILFFVGVYFLLVGPCCEYVKGAQTATVSQMVMFVVGVMLFYLAQAGPIRLLGHVMFTFHMFSMAICYLMVPPLIILGLPVWVWTGFTNFFKHKTISFVSKPIVAAILFNSLFSIYHFPAVHDYVMLNFIVHPIYDMALFISALLMWWTIIDPLSQENKIPYVTKMGVIFLNMVLLTPACGLIIFASYPLYLTYTDPLTWAKAMNYCVSDDPSALLRMFGGPASFNLLSSAGEDQQVGGILMKLIQEVIFGTMLGRVFFQWYKHDQQAHYEENVHL